MKKLYLISLGVLKSHLFICFLKKSSFSLLIFVIASYQLMGQSVIEMTDPADAEVVLLSVDKKEDADIIVFKTHKKSESKQWDCMWRFRKWGFSDLSIFIFSNLNDTVNYRDEDAKYTINGKVYFTQNIKERGYKDPNFRIQGIIRKFNNIPVDSLNDTARKVIVPKYFVNISGNVTYSDQPKTIPEGLKIAILDSSLSNTIYRFTPESSIFTQKIQVAKGRFNITVDANGYSQKIEPLKITESDTALDFTLNAMLNPVIVPKPEVVIASALFFEFNSNVLKPESQIALDKVSGLMKDNPQIKVELIGYADSKGTDSYNDKLSLQRSKAAVEYLKSKGIANERLTTVGRGENNPVALNINTDGSDCPEGRKYNRRVEIKVSNFEPINIKMQEIQIPSELRAKSK
jgi:outer membrane protein OmpA-like peptidoglycan-associated protein